MSVEQQKLNFSDIKSTLVISSDVTRNRHRNSPESKEAHDRIVVYKEEIYGRIMAIYQAREEYGATSHEISRATGIPLQTVSARLSELHHKLGKLKKSGLRRNGAAVLQIV